MNIVILLGLLVTFATGIPVLLQLLRGHPKGLIVLFFAEMWERFSYYGMRGILIFYLTQHLLFDRAEASSVYASYTALVYLLPLLGGFIADRWLGSRKAVAFGALLLVAGHISMGFEGRPAQQDLIYGGRIYPIAAEGRMDDRVAHILVEGKKYEFGPREGGGITIPGVPIETGLPASIPDGQFEIRTLQDPGSTSMFYFAVSLIILGVGFLKPNISAVVGDLYPHGDPRRDSGFTLYYYGINLGAFWASILCGLLGQHFGWWAGFGLAGVGMFLGWVVFMLGKPLLEGKGEPPNPAKLREPFAGLVNREWMTYIMSILAIGIVYLTVQNSKLVGGALIAAIILSIAALAWIIVRVCQTTVERQRMGLAAILVLGSVVFFTLFEQAGSSLNLFASTNVDLSLTQAAGHFLGIPFGTPDQLAAIGVKPTSWWSWIDTSVGAAQTQSFNAGFILIFAPILAALWTWLGRRGKDPNPTLKFGFGLVQVGLGFLIVVWGAGLHDSAFRVPLILLGLLYLLHTTGELFLSPVGLSEITKLTLPGVVSFMMAVWFLASSIAQFVGGFIAGLLVTESVGGEVLDPKLALDTAIGGFNALGWAGVGFGVVFILLSFLVRGWAHTDKPVRTDAEAETATS
ncbi:peptide MFS transporter [Phenylobacterium sp.]|jgi:POT family proton-dependent oligopeptide transporter|uniref:peptide MFS transporter n=1 Tax=Phenylobacterium sp. TaxID=1871053 RepID=UPI0037C6D94E